MHTLIIGTVPGLAMCKKLLSWLRLNNNQCDKNKSSYGLRGSYRVTNVPFVSLCLLLRIAIMLLDTGEEHMANWVDIYIYMTNIKSGI